MYADRYAGSDRFSSSRFNPAGLAAAIGINAAVIGALLFAAPYVGIAPPGGSIDIYEVPIDPVPPEPTPQPPQPRSSARPIERIETVPPIVESVIDLGRPIAADPLPFPPSGDLAGGGTEAGTTSADPPAPAPVIVGPSIDPRYAADLQPAYPPSEQRLSREGRVTVRVLVGPDGRVRQVERVSATSDAFFAATEAQAMRRWRFRPGTRDGSAQEAWRTMTVTFRLEE